MRRTTRWMLVAARVLAAMSLAACTNGFGDEAPKTSIAAAQSQPPTRSELDVEITAWLTDEKALPATPGQAGCVPDQLHIQGLSDAAARQLVAALYAAGPASDPPLGGLASTDRARLDRAAALCGVVFHSAT
jgi:hypothetical protein